jgi:molybdenum cofactor biosynthesis enzyme MoaA
MDERQLDLIWMPTLRCNLNCTYCAARRLPQVRHGFWNKRRGDERIHKLLRIWEEQDVASVEVLAAIQAPATDYAEAIKDVCAWAQ